VPSGPARAAQTSGQVPAVRRGRVLLVDDDPLVGRTVQRVLARDHQVVTAQTVEEAWERLQRGERYDTIFCDLMLSKLDGLDLFSRLESLDPEQAARFVLLTAGSFSTRAQEIVEAKGIPCIFKPFSSTELRMIVAQLILKQETA
jgi:CheY-like chemotaxis protein